MFKKQRNIKFQLKVIDKIFSNAILKMRKKNS